MTNCGANSEGLSSEIASPMLCPYGAYTPGRRPNGLWHKAASGIRGEHGRRPLLNKAMPAFAWFHLKYPIL